MEINFLLLWSTIYMPAFVLSSDWFYLNFGAGTPIGCSSTPNYFQCAADDGSNCKWGVYGTSWTSFQKMSGVTALAPLVLPCPADQWPSQEGYDSCDVLACYEGSDWFYLNYGAGTPVRCSSTPDMMQCASDNAADCKWGTYGTSWTTYQQMSGVSAIAPLTLICPAWLSLEGYDTCEQLGCYSESPTKDPTISPTANPSITPTSTTLSPTYNPTVEPTIDPTMDPTTEPTIEPTSVPSKAPTLGPTLEPTTEPTLEPTNDPSTHPTNVPSNAPTLDPTSEPTTEPTLEPTPIPTLSTPIRRNFVLSLFGDLDEVQQYLNETNSSLVVWAKGVIQKMFDVTIYPQLAKVIISIHNIARGSIIIDYSLELNNVIILDLAQAVINSTVQIHADGNFTFAIISNGEYTLNPTQNPTYSPTKKPTKSPLANAMTYAPSADPTTEPTTAIPTTAPTPKDVQCNDPVIKTEIDGDYEYIFQITELSTVRFDTCLTTNAFNIWIEDILNINTNYSCNRCGSVCPEAFQYQPTLAASTYLMKIRGAHAFQMICIPITNSNTPTQSPLTYSPTKTPTLYPTKNPTTARPTKRNHPVFNVSFPGRGKPFASNTFLGDPYTTFTSYIDIKVNDAQDVLGVSALCSACFVWQYRVINSVWQDIDYEDNDDISVSNTKMDESSGGITSYRSSLTVQSIRRLNSGKCVQEDDSRIFTAGNTYELRVKFVVNNEEYFISATSNLLSIDTNTLPLGGVCIIQNLENLEPLMKYNLFCDGWSTDNDHDLEYNALIKDVLMSKSTYVDDPRELISLAPTGNVSITVLVKEKDVNNAITCYTIDATFKTISETISDKLNENSTHNVSSIINAILTDVSTLTEETSFSESPDVAVSIIDVVENIYAQDLTTQNEAAMIVNDVVSNIIGGSGILDIVINVGNDPGNISWAVIKGDDIITELSTISSITSNEDIVDVSTTTSSLVENYLPQIFEAVDVFVATSSENNGTGTSSMSDVLYIIAEQSQGLIENLEATLQISSALRNTNDTEAINNLNTLAESLVDYATLAAAKALIAADAGVSFNYEAIDYNEDGSIANKKVITATKFDANIIDYSNLVEEDIILPKIGSDEQNIALPLSFMQQQNGFFDCVVMTSSRTNFISMTQTDRTQESETVSINIYGDEEGTRRRRLITFESDACYPYLITIGTKDVLNYAQDMFNNLKLGKEASFPSCDFWSTSNKTWSTSGCFVYKVHAISGTVTCGCTHLTTFSLSADDILPETNIVSSLQIRNFTIKNLYDYPMIWLTCFGFFFVFMIICIIDPRSQKVADRHILAYEDIIYKSFQEKVLYKDIIGKEIHYFSTKFPNPQFVGQGIKKIASDEAARKSLCSLQWNLFVANLRNEHTFISVFGRTDGTNFSARQRLACFYMYLCNILAVTASFYGLEQSSLIQDITASLFISLCGSIPATLVRNLFVKAKPVVIKSTKSKKKEDGRSTTHHKQEESVFATDWLKSYFSNTMHVNTFRENLIARYDDKEDKTAAKIKTVSEVRTYLFNAEFPLPHKCKKVGWIILILWSIAATFITIIYGLSFDIQAQQESNANNANIELYQNSDCWNTTLSLQIENKLSQEKFVADYMQQEMKNASSYMESDSHSWMFSIFQSLAESMLIWDPLNVYIINWIRVWLFAWNLKLETGYGNLAKLVKKCCCNNANDGDDDDDDDDDDDEGSDLMVKQLSKHFEINPNKAVKVTAAVGRPVDLISFLGNDVWIIDDTKDDKEDDDLNLDATETKEVELEVISKNDGKKQEEAGTIMSDSGETTIVLK